MRGKAFQPGFLSGFMRLTQIVRLQSSLVLVLVRQLVKRIFRLSTSQYERDVYYYYLTLINCDCTHQSLEDGIVTMQRGGKRYRARFGGKHSDLECFNQIFGRTEYDELQKLFIANFSGTPRTILDLGSNVGYATLYFKELWPGSSILSVEPDSANFAMLKRNIEVNNLVGIQAKNVGVWNKDTHLRISRKESTRGDWSFSFEESPEPTDVFAVDFNSIVNHLHEAVIDILKMDIEGTEFKLFENEDYMTNILNRTKVIGIEIHDHMGNRERVESILRREGFQLHSSGDMTFGVNKRIAS